jgi:hypothetical protein
LFFNRCAIVAQSLRKLCEITASSLRDRWCVTAAASMRNRYVMLRRIFAIIAQTVKRLPNKCCGNEPQGARRSLEKLLKKKSLLNRIEIAG